MDGPHNLSNHDYYANTMVMLCRLVFIYSRGNVAGRKALLAEAHVSCHAELLGRIEFKQEGEEEFHTFHPVASLLSYLTKAPLVAR